MSLWSKQLIFCNACGKEEHRILPGMGKDYKVCSRECLLEMQTRYYNSMLNKEYQPFSKKFDEYGNEIKDQNNT
jgi:hypothetical protein